MVKNKNYNHREIGILHENDLHRMKVPPGIIKGNHPQTHQRVAGTRTQTRRRRKGVQTVTRQGQKGRDAPTLIRKEEKTTLGRVRKRKT
jgi:hypothetical protein